jgi:hypothetical protein
VLLCLLPLLQIILSVAEHHSNLVPWQLVAQKTGAVLKHVRLTDSQELDMQVGRGGCLCVWVGAWTGRAAVGERELDMQWVTWAAAFVRGWVHGWVGQQYAWVGAWVGGAAVGEGFVGFHDKQRAER